MHARIERAGGYTPAEKKGRDTQKEIKRKGKPLFFFVTKTL